jgi:hypothetical protein
MGSSFMRLGKTVVREGFEQISKQLTKEQPNVAGKIIGGFDNATKSILSKEIADYPPSAEMYKDILRNHPEDLPVWVRELKGQKVNQQTAEGVQNIVNKANKPEVAAKAAAVADQLPEPPPVHNIADINQQNQWKKDTLATWLLENEDAIRSGEIDATAPNFGEIIYKNKRQRVSTKSIEAFLDSPGNDVKLLKLKAAALEPATRDIQADFANIDVAVRSLEDANKAFTETQGATGVNPEWLNPESMRKGTMRGANYAREITRKIRKMKGFEDFDVQQGHAIDLSKGKGTDVHRSFMAETGIGNRASNRKEIGGSVFDNESMAVLEQPGGGRPDLAEAIKSEGPKALQRKEEYKQFGWLQAVWDQALIAMETKGKGMDEVNKLLKAQRDALKKGELAGLKQFKLPGSKVTLDDMLVIQQKALKTGDPISAAEEVLAQRELFEWGKANGLVDNPDTFKLLKRYMKDIDTRIKVEDAKVAGPQKFEYSDRAIEDFPKGRFQRLPSQATGK